MSKQFSHLELFRTKQINMISIPVEEVTTLKNLDNFCSCFRLIQVLSDFLQFISVKLFSRPGDKPIWMEGCWEEENHFIPSLGVPKGGKALKTKEAWMGKQIYLNFCSLGLNVNTLIISFLPYTTSCGRISNDNCGVDGIGGSDDLNQ